MRSTGWPHVIAVTAVFSLCLGIYGSSLNQSEAQVVLHAIGVPTFEYDPFWPKPLPDRWVTGNVKSVCIDAADHVFSLNLGNLNQYEQKNARAAPLVTEFDPDGNLVNSWGTADLLPGSDDPTKSEPHGCF